MTFLWHWHHVTYLNDIDYMCHCKTVCDVLWCWHHVTLTDLCRDRNLLDDPAHHNRLITETQHRHNLIIHSIYTQVPDNIYHNTETILQYTVCTQVPDNISFWNWKKYVPPILLAFTLIYFLAMKKLEKRQVLTDACTI